MLVRKISFVRPNLLEEIPDIEDYNLNVFIELEDGYTYTVVIATAKNILSLMDKEKLIQLSLINYKSNISNVFRDTYNKGFKSTSNLNGSFVISVTDKFLGSFRRLFSNSDIADKVIDISLLLFKI